MSGRPMSSDDGARPVLRAPASGRRRRCAATMHLEAELVREVEQDAGEARRRPRRSGSRGVVRRLAIVARRRASVLRVAGAVSARRAADGRRGASAAGAVAGRLAISAHRLRATADARRQEQGERAALARRAARPWISPPSRRASSRLDRQAEAGAAVLAARAAVGLLERLEDQPLLVGRDADAGVARPRSATAAGRLPGIELAPASADDSRRRLGELERVREQVLAAPAAAAARR